MSWKLVSSCKKSLCAFLCAKSPDQTGPPVHLLELESRVLYSASPLGVIPEDVAAYAEHLSEVGYGNGETGVDWAPDDDRGPLFRHFEQIDAILDLTDPATTDSSSAVELIVIDSGVENSDVLIADLLNKSWSGSDVALLVLEAGEDGVARITEFLLGFERVDALHIVSHGSSGQLRLGNAVLSTDTLNTYALQLELWGDSLTAGADMLIYGCDFTSTRAGEQSRRGHRSRGKSRHSNVCRKAMGRRC